MGRGSQVRSGLGSSELPRPLSLHPRLTTPPTKHPRCLGIQSVSHANLQAGECESTNWKETNEVFMLGEPSLQDGFGLHGNLILRMLPHGAQSSIKLDFQVPHQGTWGPKPFLQFSGPREKATQDAC